jgi:anaphase-promoting complex subunit 6
VYLKAAQLMPGCHLPLLYIGMEYSLTNNHPFAEKFLKQARKIAPCDPFVLHELGVTAFNNQDYDTAEKYYTCALKEIKTIHESAGEVSSGLTDKWEALLNNLGHTYRKQERYEEALAFFKQALVLSPLNPSTYSSIGFVMSLTNDLSGAVEYFHKALGLRPEDTFSTTMLNEVIERLMCEIEPFPDYPDQIPRFGPLGGSGLEGSTADDLNLNTSSELGNDSSIQGNISTSELTPAGLLTPINTDSQQTLGDASNLSIDCEMESISRTPTDFTDLDNSLKD